MSRWNVVGIAVVALSLSVPAFADSDHHHSGLDSKAVAEWHAKHCVEHYARTAGHLAELEVKLNVTEAQHPAFAEWRRVTLDAAAKRRDACAAAPVPGATKPTVLDREAWLEKALSLRLASLQSTRPALTALYGQLSAEQKAVLDHGHKGDWHHSGKWSHEEHFHGHDGE